VPPPSTVAPAPRTSGGKPPKGGSVEQPPAGPTTIPGGLETLNAAGVIRARHGNASFEIHGVNGTHVGFVFFNDPAAGVRFNVTNVSGLAIDGQRGTAALHGTALNLVTHRRVTFRISVAVGHPSRFTIALGNGYTRGGELLKGQVALAL
jgi:hypothetical protein